MYGKFYEQLNLGERVRLQSELSKGVGVCALARALNRSASTIGRELARNRAKPGVSIAPNERSGPFSSYSAEAVQRRARRLIRQPRVVRRLHSGTALREHMIDDLRVGFSPEQIGHKLKHMHPASPDPHLCHETIYSAIYAMPRGKLRSEVIALLRFGHNKRRPRTRGKDRRSQIPDAISIHDRPAEIDERLIPGHWEADLIKGRYNRSSVGPLVERTMLFTVLAKMESNGIEAAVKGFSHVLSRIDAQHRLFMTYDRGREMARHTEITERTGVKVYFSIRTALAARHQRKRQRIAAPISAQRREPEPPLPG